MCNLAGLAILVQKPDLFCRRGNLRTSVYSAVGSSPAAFRSPTERILEAAGTQIRHQICHTF